MAQGAPSTSTAISKGADGRLDYGKWDKLQLSDSDDDKPKKREPLLRETKTNAHYERDAALTEHFITVLRKHLGKEKYPLSQRKLLARFIAVQSKGDEPSNVYRYSDITAMVAQYPEKLLRRSSIELLCDLHKTMLKSTEDTAKTNPVMQDAQIVLEALNVLEAIYRHGSAPDLFEQICNPSHSVKAREAAEKYERLEYAKMAMMRSLFGDEQYEQLEQAANTADKDAARGVDWDVCKAVVYAICGIIFMVVSVFYLFNKLRSSPEGAMALKELFGKHVARAASGSLAEGEDAGKSEL